MQGTGVATVAGTGSALSGSGGEIGNPEGPGQRIERKLENTVGDAFARVFGGSIVPEEVEAALLREASDGVHTLQGGRFGAERLRHYPQCVRLPER